MSKQRLTDRLLASGISLNNLVHIVNTGDTTQNPYGSSFKGTVQQLATAIGGSGGLFVLTTSGTTGPSTYIGNNLNVPNYADTFVTGFTYNPNTNRLTIERNESQPDLFQTINSVSGLSFSNLTDGRVVYVGSGGLITDQSGFTYNDSTYTLGVTNIEAYGNVIIDGSLTVFGPSISAFTTELYVEDSNIIINYNPTGSTTGSSVNSGFSIQDGNGINSGDVNLNIITLENLTGLTSTEIPIISGYTSDKGYENRGWITQLNDIVIRSTNVTDNGLLGDVNGVRVIAEFDILDGGSY